MPCGKRYPIHNTKMYYVRNGRSIPLNAYSTKAKAGKVAKLKGGSVVKGTTANRLKRKWR